MTTATLSPARATGPARPHTGTGTLVRLMLRRDRIKLPLWIAGLGLYVLYIGAALPALAATKQELGAIVPLLQQPVGRMFTGPAYGLDAPTYARVFASGYALYLLLIAALMNIMLISRHTRVEEQSGRAELVRANVTGRHASLTAALIVAVIANVLGAAIVSLLAVVAIDFPITGSVILGVGVGLVGMAFAGITAVTVQLSAFSRTAAGMAGVVLGASFLLRAVGDMAAIGGSGPSWASPLGWVAQTAPYVLDRWWPLLLLAGLAVLTIVLAFVLQARRDLGAGLLATRPGRPQASRSLGTPWGLAARLQRSPALAWGVAITVLGVVDGAFTQVMIDSVDDLPPTLKEIFGASSLVDGYIGFLAVLIGYLTGAYVVYAVQSLRAEEKAGRAESVLATPTGRTAWAGAHHLVIAVSASVIMLVAGLLTGVAAGIVTSDWSLVADAVVAHLNMIPAVLVVLGVSALLHGWAPALLAPVGWALVAVMVFVGNFAALLDLPEWVSQISPLSHPAQYPSESIEAAPLLVLAAICAAGVALGLIGLRRRQIVGRS
ncbi:ABC transporter permease [Enemella sp. A6]|uniref:ABC transporter permease n=1 Tax=Enemella sp. A6 TaxID=3440152 RepID=UPI003EBDB89A